MEWLYPSNKVEEVRAGAHDAIIKKLPVMVTNMMYLCLTIKSSSPP